MIIAIDYDGTITADTKLFTEMIREKEIDEMLFEHKYGRKR